MSEDEKKKLKKFSSALPSRLKMTNDLLKVKET